VDEGVRGCVARWWVWIALAVALVVALLALSGCQACVDDSAQPDPAQRPTFVEGGPRFRPRLASPLSPLVFRIRDAGDD
jgi:hypothetical protein